MGTRRTWGWTVVASLATAGVAYGDDALPAALVPGGIPADAPFVTVDPMVDGADSFVGEWTDALIASDGFLDPTTGVTPAGLLYYENRTNWRAVSKTGGADTYLGPTFFIAHDIFGAPTGLFASFRSNDPSDWNYVKVIAPDLTVVECWNFGGFTNPTTPPHVPPSDANEVDDGIWLPDAGGLGSSSLIPEGPGSDLIDDRGFIVRKNMDPTTDRHWFPGLPQPGDAGWVWEDYYGCFARAGFNQTFQTNGTDPDPAHAFDHEVYEWCFHTAIGGPPPPLQCTEWRLVWIDPPKRWVVFVAPNWFIHWGFPPIPATPWPFLAGIGLALAAGGYWVFRGKRSKAVLTLMALALAVPCLAACGGGGGHRQQKIPPYIEIPIPVLREGWQGLTYQDALQATGQNPPFTFALTGGALPNGLSLAPTGQIGGIPQEDGSFDFTFEVTDTLVNRVSRTSSIHIGDWEPTPVPIELVSLSLRSVSPIVVTNPGVEAIGSIRTRGGDPRIPTTYQCLVPPPGGAFFFSPGGVLRWTPPPSQPPGTIPIRIQSLNGGTFDTQFDVFVDVISPP